MRQDVEYVLGSAIGSFEQAEIECLIDRLVVLQPTLLLLGETGTGKSSLARYIHELADDRGATRVAEGKERSPFRVVNMAAVPTHLAESELFGHVKGSFTDAKDRVGALEDAAGGVLFLDEIHRAPKEVQAKLLVVLQERRFVRVGESTERKLDAWIMAATTKPAGIEAELRYRLEGFTLSLLPLRERGKGFDAVVAQVLRSIAKENRWDTRRKTPLHVKPEAAEWLRQQPWPGNVRQLESLLRTASYNLSSFEDDIGEAEIAMARRLRLEAHEAITGSPITGSPIEAMLRGVPGAQLPNLVDWEKEIAEAYRYRCGSKSGAAKALGIDIRTFERMLDQKRVRVRSIPGKAKSGN